MHTNTEGTFTSTGFGPDAAFVGATERFFELLKSFSPATPGAANSWSTLAGPLARQFEEWLRASQSSNFWSTMPGAAAFAATASSAPPLGGSPAEARTWQLLLQLAQLQTRLATYWREIAGDAAQRFIARVGGSPSSPGTLDQAMKLYELWVSSAEEAYGAAVHSEPFARLQSDLVNTSTALLLEQRGHLETLLKTAGLPTRGELDAIQGEMKELRRRLTELATATAPAARATPAPGRAPRSAPPRGKRAAPHRRGKRKRTRGTRD